MHCVDLGESFPTSVYLQNLASVQPRTSILKFEGGGFSAPVITTNFVTNYEAYRGIMSWAQVISRRSNSVNSSAQRALTSSRFPKKSNSTTGAYCAVGLIILKEILCSSNKKMTKFKGGFESH